MGDGADLALEQTEAGYDHFLDLRQGFLDGTLTGEETNEYLELLTEMED